MVTLPASLWLTCHDTELWGHCWPVSQVPTPPAVLGERWPPSLGLYTCTLPSQSSILAALQRWRRRLRLDTGVKGDLGAEKSARAPRDKEDGGREPLGPGSRPASEEPGRGVEALGAGQASVRTQAATAGATWAGRGCGGGRGALGPVCVLCLSSAWWGPDKQLRSPAVED